MKTPISRKHFFYFNLDKWDEGQSPLLLVTGLSGSGKTTFARLFAKHNNALCISFDVLKFYTEASKESQIILNIFLNKYPEIKELIHIKWAKTDQQNSNDILYNYYCNIFFDFLLEYSQKQKKKLILEGIQLFVRLHPSKSIGLPIIIIKKSSIKCFYNKLKRDYITNPSTLKIGSINNIIKDAYIYHLKQKKIIDSYINYLSTIYNNS